MTDELIHKYTRAEAIADGVLVDVSALAPSICLEHYKDPIAATSTVWAVIERAVENPEAGNDLAGVLHDIFSMSRLVGRKVAEDRLRFTVVIRGAGKKTNFSFDLVRGPGDEGEPVLTLMFPGED